MAAEPDSSAGAVKQEEQAGSPGASSSIRQRHAEGEVKLQEEKLGETGSKRLSSGSPQKSPAKKLRKTEDSMDSSPRAKQTKGPMDSFVIKNPA